MPPMEEELQRRLAGAAATSSSGWLPVLMAVVVLPLLSIGGYILWRRRQLLCMSHANSVEGDRSVALLQQHHCQDVELNLSPRRCRPEIPLEMWKSEETGVKSPTKELSSSQKAWEQPFSDMSIQELAARGSTENWIIKAESLVVELAPRGRRAQGGQSEVRKGKLYSLTEVAVKLPGAGSVEKQLEAKNLVLEWKLLKRMRHPNIVFFHGITLLAEQHTPLVCLVVEWVDGSDLGMYVWQRYGRGAARPQNKNIAKATEEDGDRPKVEHNGESQAIHEHELLVDVCRGMQYLHSQTPAVLHRDLKPANVLVETIVEPPRAKLADYGMSVRLSGHGWMKRSGTRSYMAPEVMRGETPTVSSDVYSFGCVCAFTLSAEHPEAESVLEVCNQRAADDNNMPWASSVAAIAAACVQEDPRGRPEFAELYERLMLTALPDNTYPCNGTQSVCQPPMEDFRSYRRTRRGSF